MHFSKLVSSLKTLSTGGPDVEVAGIAYDSRRVRPGYLFVAVPGHVADGHDFIPEALRAGATSLLVEHGEGNLPPGVAWARVPDSRRALAESAVCFYGRPADHLNLIGVTGTNGKTTTTHLIHTILCRAGLRTGLIGTIHAVIGDEVMPAERTTPESLDVQRLWRRMADAGASDIVMEVSSHALSLNRIDPADFAVTVFTNLTQDHLDFHHDMEDYFSAKALLFTGQPEHALAVINADDAWGRRLEGMSRGRVVTYGCRQGMVRAEGITVDRRGASFRLVSPWGSFPLCLKLTGLFNVYNALAAAATALARGITPGVVRDGLESVAGVAGRFERVDKGQEFTVIVDYAHTPDGLENALRAARRVTGGRVLAVFGCGGDRDRGKRSLMGRVSAELADFTTITSDNPRTEDPLSIIAQVEAGVKAVTDRYRVIPDRRTAIRATLQLACPEDIVVIAGKGHEDYQIIGGTKHPFDDRLVASEALAAMGYNGNNA